MPGHLFEGNPVSEGTTRRGTDTPMHLLETPAGSTHSLSRALRPPERLERQAEFRYSDKTRPDSPLGRSGSLLKQNGGNLKEKHLCWKVKVTLLSLSPTPPGPGFEEAP